MSEVHLALDGEPYVVRCDEPEHAELVACWSRLFPHAHGKSVHVRLRTLDVAAPRLEMEGVTVRTFDERDMLVPALMGLLYERVLRPGRGRAVLHASVLARRDRAVLFFGPSGAGKSVLSTQLARRGWTYLSDEFAPIDELGRVHPVPRPVTFLASELPPQLWREISEGLPHWTCELMNFEGERSTAACFPAFRAGR